ncbi:flavodoxin domain-containing protein [Streptomyces sp. SCSIO 30461]|uniref:flavodoxin domain-containing protein n=1 Tax=Streptomyces sp. SCSIO 30461 TaxID=3118085 RepID=UPI0030CD0475
MTTKRILVAYGSKQGGTAGIADEIGSALREDGYETAVLPARDVRDVSGYEAVVVGGSVYAGRWHRDASRFVRLHAEGLSDRPIWMFSSGPVDGSAEQHDLPPVRGLARHMERLQAREHITFGDSITASTPGWIARYLVRHAAAGDFHSPEQIQGWAHHISAELADRP